VNTGVQLCSRLRSTRVQRPRNTLEPTVLPNTHSTPVSSLPSKSRIHRLPVTSRIKYKLATITFNSLSVRQPPICTCYFGNANQFSLFVRVTRMCWLYVQQHLSLADAPSAIPHVLYGMTMTFPNYSHDLCKDSTSSNRT